MTTERGVFVAGVKEQVVLSPGEVSTNFRNPKCVLKASG